MNEAANYYRWILGWFAPFLGKRIVEVGAGIGSFASHLLNSTEVPELILVEPANNLLPLLHERHSDNARVQVMQGYLRDLADSLAADSLLMVNVLEHVSEEADFLRAAYQALVPGGALLLYVPALPWLYGSLDEAFEHRRRYAKPSLAAKLEQAGFRIELLRYVNLPGVFAWFAAAKVLRRRSLSLGSVRFYDRWIVPICSRLERRWEPPLGQNLLAVARK